MLAEALAPEQSNRHEEFFASLLEGLEPALADLARRIEEARGREGAVASLPDRDLKRIAGDIYQPAHVRKEAADFLATPELRKELRDALTIFLAEIDGWDWPAEGLSVRTLWTRNKWRPFLDVDLPTACLLEAVGMSWVFIWQQQLQERDTVAERRRRLRKLQKLNAPSVLIDNERRMLELARQRVFLELSDEIDPWFDGETSSDDEAGGSVLDMRMETLSSLRVFPIGGDYSADADNQTLTVQFLNAEMRLTRTAYPDRPLHIVKIDLQDYYASIPHDVLLTVLAKLGVPERDRRFFQRYLTPPLSSESAADSPAIRHLPLSDSGVGADAVDRRPALAG